MWAYLGNIWKYVYSWYFCIRKAENYFYKRHSIFYILLILQKRLYHYFARKIAVSHKFYIFCPNQIGCDCLVDFVKCPALDIQYKGAVTLIDLVELWKPDRELPSLTNLCPPFHPTLHWLLIDFGKYLFIIGKIFHK